MKSEKDFWSGLMFLVAGIGFAWGATNYSFGSAARPGPAYFPFGLGVILAGLGAIILLKSLVIETEGGDRIGSIAWKQLGIIVGSVVLFGITLPLLLGFILGPMMEENLRRALLLSRGDWMTFMNRPLSASLLLAALALVVIVSLPSIKSKRESAFKED
jgi:hypothetical protein